MHIQYAALYLSCYDASCGDGNGVDVAWCAGDHDPGCPQHRTEKAVVDARDRAEVKVRGV